MCCLVLGCLVVFVLGLGVVLGGLGWWCYWLGWCCVVRFCLWCWSDLVCGVGVCRLGVGVW